MRIFALKKHLFVNFEIFQLDYLHLIADVL